MAVTLITSVGNMPAATGRSVQGHLVYAVNSAKWWLFYLSSTNVLNSAYSSDFSSWSAGSTVTTSFAHNSEGRAFGIGYTNLASKDVVHLAITYPLYGASLSGSSHHHSRITIGATTFTVSNAESEIAGGNVVYSAPGAPATLLAVNGTSGTVTDCSGGFPVNGAGNFEAERSTNADNGTAWTAGFGSTVNIQTQINAATSYALADLGSGNVLAITDNNPSTGTFTQLIWSKWTTSWSAAASVLASTVTATGCNQWGMVGVTTSDVHVVALSNNSNAFVHRRFNGTSWSNGQSIPALTLLANSGLFLVSNGTNAWLFAIDSSNNVKYLKWTAATPAWDASWTLLDSGGANARTYITGEYSAALNTIAVCWTEVNGASNYNIAGATLNLTVAPPYLDLGQFPNLPAALLAM